MTTEQLKVLIQRKILHYRNEQYYRNEQIGTLERAYAMFDQITQEVNAAKPRRGRPLLSASGGCLRGRGREVRVNADAAREDSLQLWFTYPAAGSSEAVWSRYHDWEEAKRDSESWLLRGSIDQGKRNDG
jgi:hypothetical protein